MLAAATVLSLPALCAAQTSVPRASLVVTRSDGAQACPDAVALAAQVRGVSGANVIGVGLASTPAEPVETWVQVAIGHDFGGYRAQISTLGLHHGTRTLEDLGPGCSSLADAVAVTIAIFLDPYANAPALAPPPAVVAPSAPVIRAVPKRAPRKESPLEPFVDASGGVTVGVVEHAEALLSASIGLHLAERWSLAVGASYVFPDTSGDSVDLSLSYGYLLGCGRALGTRDGARIDWCAAPLLGSLAGTGKKFSKNATRRVPWFAVAAGPQVTFPFGSSLSWVLTGQAVLPLIRNGFDSSEAGNHAPVFRPATVAGLVSLGIRGEL